MSFTKEDFADIRNFYEAYFESYQHGDTEKMLVFLDDELRLSGSIKHEIIHHKKDAVEYLKASETEVARGVEFRNRRVNITPVFPVAMVTELNDLYIQINGEWTFCGHVRNTVMVQKKSGQWKVVQQESSLPDTRTSGNEIFAFEKIREENLLLREAVERSAAELEHKNRELEIEAALEKVRSMAMDMREPADMLGVCRCIASQLEFLNVKGIRNVQTANFIEEKNIYVNYQYYARHDLAIVDEVDYRVHPVQADFARQMMKRPGEFFSHHFEGDDLKVWFETQKKTNQFVDHFLDNAQTLDYYFFSLEDVALGISTYSSLNENEIQLFKRFRNVFELAYRRFADVRSAEAQTREAKIEAALERVRAKTMAMHNSEAVGETVCALFDELIKLGVKTHRCGIAIFKTDPLFEIWTAKSEAGKKSTLVIGELDMSIHPMLSAVFQSWKEMKTQFVYELAGDSLRNYYEAINAYVNYPTKFNLADIPEKETLNEFYFKEGALFAFTAELLSEDSAVVCRRFASVFGQTYRRYLDLQKAEAQAKEAQIEAALERVRSQSMAMHTSSDLQEVIRVVTDQLKGLDVKFDHCSFSKIHSEGSWDLWISTPEQPYPAEIHLPYFDHPIFNRINVAIARGVNFYSDTFSFEEKNSFFRYFFENTVARNIPEARQQFVLKGKGYSSSIFQTKNIWLNVANYEGQPWSEEENAIFRRFANVFEQSYTRFLDLQKAEAQAKEAQIETALERVRSQSMAMHTSNDLQEVIRVVNEQLLTIGIKFDHVTFVKRYDDRSWDLWIATPGQRYSAQVHMPFFDTIIFREVDEIYSRGLEFFSSVYSQEEKNAFFRHFFDQPAARNIPEERKQFVLSRKGMARSAFLTKIIWFNVANYDAIPYTDEENAILRRFAYVFEQSYTRFLDLQKAEAQAKEAKIEAALERVRSRALSMQNSEELNALIGFMFTELTKLDMVLTRCVLIIPDPKTNDTRWWMANSEAPEEPANFRVRAHEHKPHLAYLKAWKDRDPRWVYTLEGNDKREWDDFLFTQTELSLLPDFVIAGMRAPERVYLNTSSYSFGNLTLASLDPLSDEHFDILIRFAKVFDLTYTRFSDLKQAEARARESQIEASLERVRSKALAMHTSTDLNMAVATVFEELDKLDLGMMRCGIGILDKEKRTGEIFTTVRTEEGMDLQIMGVESIDIHPLLQGAFNAWINHQDFAYRLEGDNLDKYYEAVSRDNFKLPESQGIVANSDVRYHDYFMAAFDAGGLYAFREQPFLEEAKAVLKRFANVFNLTYKRFLDLQKAEAQAHEARIQLALERVRARTMAMQQSDELAEAAAVLFQQFAVLGNEPDRISIGIINEEESVTDVWATDQAGTEIKLRFRARNDEETTISKMLNDWRAGKKSTIIDLQGSDLNKWIRYIREELGMPIHDENFHGRRLHQVSFLSQGWLNITTLEPVSPAMLDLLDRFAAVFNLTYTRFLDLQKAEAQAREAIIEASLEKVRGMAMAMHNSEDLSSTASMVFTELRKLGIRPIRCGVGLLHKETTKAQLYASTSSPAGDQLGLIGWVMLEGHPVLAKVYESWLTNEDFFPELCGEELDTYYKQLLSGLSIPAPTDWKMEETQFGHFFPFSVGMFYAWADRKYTAAEVKIFKRFAAIIDLTFRRYTELKASEASAWEAVRRASLDRVRAEIASMRTTTDLEKITPVIWNELTVLGIPFSRCGVFIMDEDKEQMHSFLSTPDGKAIAAFHLPYDAPGNVPAIVSHWHDNKVFVDHWDEATFNEWTYNLVKLGLMPKEDSYLSNLPHGLLHLYFLPFLQGMLYVGNQEELKESDLNLAQAVAESFSTAYARYEDFNRLEIAKQQVDRALIELKQAQTQLIQSEKMASLGELTAGIAHEIQNPLNFVNNFSEIGNELIAEMNEEIKRGEYQQAAQIADDLRQNLEKINQHGKRADGIVKAMLQHSRTSSNVKEPADLNALCDEYLRLSYHGLRAKDKVFNAQLETDFDENLGKVEVIAQDISRVLLNLFNNAFYAVMERKKKAGPDYQPKVTVSTRKKDNNVVITVKDNGMGIPARIREKIFQPFFTTKPTGQGTGLGLSLSYDIITLGHGGSFELKSTVGEGTSFSIIIPN